jgi:SepF-like predicted cell division protein (DUF552 family)
MKHNEQIFSEDSLSISINTLHKFLKHELFYHLKHIYENFNGDIDTLKKNLIICASKNLGFNAIIEKEN